MPHLSSWLNLRHPLWHFLAIGLALFLLYTWLNPVEEVALIELTGGDITRIEQRLAQQLGRAPDQPELQQGIASAVTDEALFREALAQQLHLSDEVVRHRLVQIMGFLQEDVNPPEPGAGELEQYFQRHLSSYSTTAQQTFRQVFFSNDLRGDRARIEAQQALEQLQQGVSPKQIDSDPFVEGSRFFGATTDFLQRQFGAEFANKLEAAAEKGWQGPVASAFGWHLVYVEERQHVSVPVFAEIRRTVLIDWRTDYSKRSTEERINEVVRGYRVSIDGKPWLAADSEVDPVGGESAGQ